MWLRRLVAVVMIVTCLGLNAIVVVGIFSKEKTKDVGFDTTQAQQVAVVEPPTVTISASPGALSAGSFSALKWEATGNPESCTASDNWTGTKTASGTESTGRISKPGTYTYTLICKNAGGEAKASAIVSVGAANQPPPASSSSTITSTSQAAKPTYCSGRQPCYGPKDIAAHSSSSNCWGWNGDRVINISGFDQAYHKAKSGISSIEVGDVCGKDLAPSLNGSISAGGQTRNHNQTTKNNADRNEIPYFVGYFDSSKP